MTHPNTQLPPEITQDKNRDELPAYTPSCLKPFTAVQNIRYDRLATSRPVVLNIECGLHSNMLLAKPQYLPSGWQECNNPEGSRYYVNESLHAITDSPIHRPEVYEALERGLREYEAAVAILEKPLPQRSEIFIQLENDDIDLESCKCNYYIVDHDTRTEFWLHPTDSYALGLGRVTSEFHLKHILQKHYWTHMDYYPHVAISLRCRQELVNILRHGLLDFMTSRTSTFPYTITDCERYLKVLHDSMDSTSDIYLTSMTARMWTMIAHHRAENFFGEDHARLERTHYVYGQPITRRSWIMAATSPLFFGLPAQMNNSLEALYVDDTVYSVHWQKFMGTMIHSWKDSRLMAALAIIIDAILLVTPKGPISMYLGLASTLCGTVSVATSQYLLQRYAGSDELVAELAVKEIEQLEGGLRFQLAAIVYSTPKAFVHWSLVLLAFQILSVIFEVSTSWGTLIMAALFSIILSIVLVTFMVRRGIHLWREFRSRKSEQCQA